MKEIKTYQCEICGTQYADKNNAEECEKLHANCIKTTLKEVKHRECEMLLKKYAKGYEFTRWENNFYIYVTKFYDELSNFYCMFNFGVDVDTKDNVVYFATKADAKKAIDEIGEERLLKDYFQVEV